MLDLNVHPSKIIFANPCKQKSHLRYADKYDLYFMTFDNEAELDKVKATCPQQRYSRQAKLHNQPILEWDLRMFKVTME